MKSSIALTLISFLYISLTGQAIQKSIDNAFDYYIYEIDTFQSIIDSIYSLDLVLEDDELQDRYFLLKSFYFYPEDHIDSIQYFLSLVPEKLSRRNTGFRHVVEGRVKEYNSDFEETIRRYTTALEYLDEELDKTFITWLHLAIGINHYRNLTNEKAYEHLNIALERAKIYSMKYHIVESLDWMASAYSRAGQLEKADSLWTLFQEYAEEIDNAELQFYALTNIGNSYNFKKQHDIATIYFEQAYEFSKNLDDPSIEREALMYLGEQYAWSEDYKNASRVYELIKDYPVDTSDIHVGQRIKYFGAQTKAGLNNYQEAYKLLYEYDSISSAYWKSSTKDQILEFETKYKVAQKDKELARQQLQINQGITQRNLILIGVAGLLLFTWFLFYRNRKNDLLAHTKIQNLEKQQQLLALDYMVQGQEEERKRIAQDLHDGLGGMLTSVRHQIRSIQDQIDALTKSDLIGNAESMIEKACDEVRRISHDMMPASLVSLGLVDAVEDLVDDIKSKSALYVDFVHIGDLNEISDKVKVNLYRLIQEITNNALKHSGATKLSFSLIKTDKSIELKIADDGRGFNYQEAKANGGIGLKSIESRVKYLGGKMIVESDGKGTRVDLNIPV